MTNQPAEPTGAGHSAATARWRRVAGFLIYAVIAGLLARQICLLLEQSLWVVRCPYEVEYGEGVVLRLAMKIADGSQVYTDYSHYPFMAATYMPFYPVVCALGVKLFGVSFAFGRALSCVATLAIMALIWAMLRRAGKSQFAAVSAALLFLAAPTVRLWMPQMRVDMPAIALSLAALYCVMLGGRWLVGGVALMALALYTRQSEVAPVAASVVYLWWIGERRNAVLVAASVAALALGAFAILQAESGGWFYRSVVVANQNRWDAGWFVAIWKSTALRWPLPFLLAVSALPIALIRPRPGAIELGARLRRRPELLLALFFLLALPVSVTAGKAGAHVNHTMEALIAACLAAGVAVDYVGACRTSRWGGAAWAAAWLVLAGSLLYPIVRPASVPNWREKIMTGGKEAMEVIRRTRGDILSDDIGLLVLAGRPVFLDSHKMTTMFLDGRWDQRPVVEDIKRRRFALIITKWDPIGGASDTWGAYGNLRWSIGMGRAIMRNYSLVKQVGYIYITAPADATHPSCAEVKRRLKLAPTGGQPSGLQ